MNPIRRANQVLINDIENLEAQSLLNKYQFLRKNNNNRQWKMRAQCVSVCIVNRFFSSSFQFVIP